MLYNLAYVVFLIGMMFLHQMPVIMCTVLTACLCFTAGGIPNLMPSMVISKFGRYEFMSANRVCTPLATIIQSCGFAILVLGKSLGGGNNWFAGYGVFVVLCLIGAFVISRIDDKKESDDAAIEQELLAKAKSHSAK